MASACGTAKDWGEPAERGAVARAAGSRRRPPGAAAPALVRSSRRCRGRGGRRPLRRRAGSAPRRRRRRRRPERPSAGRPDRAAPATASAGSGHRIRSPIGARGACIGGLTKTGIGTARDLFTHRAPARRQIRGIERQAPAIAGSPSPSPPRLGPGLLLGGHRVDVGQGGQAGRVLLGPGHQLVAGLAVVARQRPRPHPEVDRLGMVGDDRQRRLLGLDGVAPRQPQADGGRVEQPEDLLQLGLLGAGGIAPAVAAALGGGDAELGAHAAVQPFGHALGGLHAQTMREQLLGKLSVGLQLGHQLGDLLAGGDGLQRDDVGLGVRGDR